ncbi:MAG TPA: RDD family protein [Candidatus Binatia bacterium]
MYCPHCGARADNLAVFCQSCGQALPWSAPGAPVAGFCQRVAARIVDVLVLYALWLAAVFCSGVFFGAIYGPTSSHPDLSIVLFLASVIAWLAYFSYMHGAYGQTLGKMLLGIKVVEANGGRISYARALGRSFAEIFSVLTLWLGYLAAAFTKRKYALHDWMTGTVVVRARPVTQLDRVFTVFGGILAGFGLVSIVGAFVLPLYIAYLDEAMVKSELKSAAAAEEAFFVAHRVYAGKVDEFESYRPDARVRVTIRPGRTGFENGYVIVARHIEGRKIYYLESATREIKAITLDEAHEAGVTELGS